MNRIWVALTSAIATIAAACAAPADAPALDERAGDERVGDERVGDEGVSNEREGAALVAPAPCEEPGRYVVSEEGEVMDTANASRLWQRAVDPALRSQSDGAAYCASLDLAGRTGWRMPDVHELQSLRLRPSGLSGGPQYCMPSIDQTAFPSTPAAEFWSATTRDDGVALYTGFDDGRTHPSDPGTPMYVRCVHDPAPPPPEARP